MKKFIGDNFWGFIGGGVTAVISIIAGLTPLQVGLVSIAVGVVFGIVHHYYDSIIVLLEQARLRYAVLFRVIDRRIEANELLSLVDEQQKNPAKWLYPVVWYIDLNRQGSGRRDNDVFVKFQIDSGLLEPINECRVAVKLCLKKAGEEIESDWHEDEVKSCLPIRLLGRHQFPEILLHLGETEKEKSDKWKKGEVETMLKWMQDFRDAKLDSSEGQPLLAMLKIGIKFQKDDKPIDENGYVLKGNGYIAPMNNYRGD